MPNPVRADARALPETTSRRAILGAALAAGAIGAIPIAAGAASAGGPAGPDAELCALIAEAREANARYDAASDAAEEAWKRTEKVPAPITFFQSFAGREAREDQLIAAFDEWKEARQLAEDRSGEAAAEERLEQLFNERYDACERVARYRARTLAGMLAKLAFIAGDFDGEEDLPAEMGTSERILFSVAVDFKALQAAGAPA